MTEYLLLIFFVIVILFIFGWIVFLFRPLHTSKKYPPFIPTRKAVVQQIVQTFGEIAPGSTVYDLGSGDGRVLIALAKAQPHAEYVGIERSRLPFYLSKLRLSRTDLSNVTFKRTSFYDEDLSRATHVFMYLYPQAMDSLLPIFEKNLPANALLVSLDFAFQDKEPEQVIDIAHLNTSLGKKILIYRF